MTSQKSFDDLLFAMFWEPFTDEIMEQSMKPNWWKNKRRALSRKYGKRNFAVWISFFFRQLKLSPDEAMERTAHILKQIRKAEKAEF